MGTTLAIRVEAADRRGALAASEAAVRALEACEARLSTWREDSELARLNRAPVGEPFAPSPALARDLARARELWRATGGAFDPAVGGLVAAWGLRSGGRTPSADELRAALVPGGFAALELADGACVRRDARLVLEEGGFGKGAGLDEALAALAEAGAVRATLDLGGQLAVLGELAGGFPFAVADPDDRARPVVRLTIDGGSLATSGNSERGVVVDGERRGHLLDPRTGAPCADFGSVTVWARDAFAADALSTALYVMGPAEAVAWAARHDGVEALVLVRDGDGLAVRATAGLANRIEVLREGVDLSVDGARGDHEEG